MVFADNTALLNKPGHFQCLHCHNPATAATSRKLSKR